MGKTSNKIDYKDREAFIEQNKIKDDVVEAITIMAEDEEVIK